ncbi:MULTISPECIES: hypothetical protein [Ponticoccus]|uniref:Lipoprotein n=1 Tax=Ponticoccus litoralis TaxID=422297 RepID=A0AAW9SN38_9RHOB
MVRVICLLLMVVSVAGCGRLGFGQGSKPLFDGQRYNSTARAVARSDRQNFVATARPVAKSLEGAIAAAEYEGIRHCITFYGTSDIDWRVGPDTPRSSLPITKNTVTLRGSCRDAG